MRKTDYVDIDDAMMLEHFGFKPDGKHMVYRWETVINPEIEKLYPNETDDGYYELTKEGGGEYDWDYVYQKDFVFDEIRYYEDEIPAPTYFEAARFLRENYKYLIVVKLFEGDFDNPMYDYEIYKDNDYSTHYRHMNLYKEYDDALKSGVKRVLKVLRELEIMKEE